MRPITIIYNFLLLLSHIAAQWQAYCKYSSLQLTLNVWCSAWLLARGQEWSLQLLERPGPVRLLGQHRRWFGLHFLKWLRQSRIRLPCRSVPSQVDLCDMHNALHRSDFLRVFMPELWPAGRCKNRLRCTDGQ